MIGFSAALLGIEIRLEGKCVSGSRNMTKKRLTSANAVAVKAGNVKFTSVSSPPRKGPITKPRPNATPMRPNAFALFSGVEISARTAVALATVPPLAPSIILERNNKPSINDVRFFQSGSRQSD